MPRLSLSHVLFAAIGVASVGCQLNRSEEQCCPTDARRLVYSCAGQEAVRQGPCGPNEAFYGHHPTCWGSWPNGWEVYQADHCAQATAVAATPVASDSCDACETAGPSHPVAVESVPREPAPTEAEPVWTAPEEKAPAIEPITPAPIEEIKPAPTVLPAPSNEPESVAPDPEESLLINGALPTYSDLLPKKSAVRSASRPVFAPPPMK